MNLAELTPLTARQSGPVQGRTRVPGDKSISHRALILGALTVGETKSAACWKARTCCIPPMPCGRLARVWSAPANMRGAFMASGIGGFAQPAGVLDFGNSGTGCRLAIGAVAGCAGDGYFRWRRFLAQPADATRARSIGEDGCAHRSGRRWRTAAVDAAREPLTRSRSSTSRRWHRRSSNRRCCWPGSLRRVRRQ